MVMMDVVVTFPTVTISQVVAVVVVGVVSKLYILYEDFASKMICL